MKTIAIIDTSWCKDHGVQLKVLCETCRRNWRELHARDIIDTSKPRSVDHEGAAMDLYSGHVYAMLTQWVAGLGLSSYLYEYQCPLRHRTYASMQTKNIGKHFQWKGVPEAVTV